VSGDVLDLILIALAAAFAVAGYRQGFIVGILSFAGFLGGAAIGATFAPKLARSLVQGTTQQALVAIVAVFVAAMIGQLLASALGAAVRSRVNWRPATVVDSVAGAVVSVLSVLLIAWLIGSAVVNAPFAMVTNQVNRSAVLRTVDGVMPSAARTMFSDFRSLLASGPYVQVFGALGAEPALTVAAPDPAVLNAKGLLTARDSIVKVIGVAPSCSRRIEGSGFVISAQHILTNAHVVAGVTQGQTVITRLGRHLPATVVLFDPERDLAVLYVPGLRAAPLAFAAPQPLGTSAIVAGYPLDENFTVVPARIGDDQLAQAPDIYQSKEVTRQIYSIRADVRAGNSGGPLLNPDGSVDGVVFAAAVGVKDTGYALTAAEVRSDASKGANATAATSTQACD
jgi:S1-C subfamily serine protease